ncbi:hypothetical protein TNCV_5090211 [Trichonephila clavipes]|nr:hypothetical protein TNCV_5090211 [Trichonephila clavipes]
MADYEQLLEFINLRSTSPKAVQCRNCGGGDRWCRPLSSLRGVSPNRTATCMMLKAIDRRTSSPLPR